ncbi:hypothetical protein E2C01_082873 [Portunus trituberculatus]|uniref:Uncharacterized protein n=1 Tax=Portunus trituberculatus TaxID=210409 RepID=A0A5B7IZL8_PORTR|nr:hypothetical protein [Portunus trituberculatus]
MREDKCPRRRNQSFAGCVSFPALGKPSKEESESASRGRSPALESRKTSPNLCESPELSRCQ